VEIMHFFRIHFYQYFLVIYKKNPLPQKKRRGLVIT
jgi:hypothetical protein